MVRKTDSETARVIRKGISAVQAEDYLLGLSILTEAYSSSKIVSAEGLSFYALCVARVDKKYKSAIELCKKAIELQFYNPYHYANLCRVYLAAGSRKKAIETILEGLRIMPTEETLIEIYNEMGPRSRPPIPFLSRSHPLNQTIGRVRHTKKSRPKTK